MLWLCIAFPRLPFDALSLRDDDIVAVTLTHKRARRLLVASRAAQTAHLSAGMDYTTAVVVCSQLQAIERNARAEEAALNRLAAWAYQWSSFVTLHVADAQTSNDESKLWLEIAASFKLFGGRDALLKRIEAELQTLVSEYRLGIACTLEGAAFLARAGKRVMAPTPLSLRRQIEPLPLSLLALDEAVRFELQRAGIRTIQALLEIPKDAIARRFGLKVNDYLDRLLGRVADPRVAFQLPKHYAARAELAAEVFSTEALLFPLRRMLCELQGYLRAIDSGVQQFSIELKHREAVTRVAIGCSAPERRAEQFFVLVRERFERLTLPAPVLEISVLADRFTEPAVQQNGIFPDSQSRQEFEHVFDKLIARLSSKAVHYCAAVEDHRPEYAWRVSDAPSTVASTTSAERPLWLLPEPRRIPAPTEALPPAERIESGWWQGDIARDYYFLTTPSGARLWVFRNLNTDEWFVHGLCG